MGGVGIILILAAILLFYRQSRNPKAAKRGNRARSDTNSESLSSAGNRKRKASDRDEPVTSQSFHNAAVMLSETLVMVGDKLSKSIGTELTLQEKVQKLDKELIQIDGLSNEEYLMALIKLPDHPNQMPVFFSLPPD
nr:DNA replication terminus site-binding [Ipomoea batatas]